jgi:lysophospholipase L1-like esterase
MHKQARHIIGILVLSVCFVPIANRGNSAQAPYTAISDIPGSKWEELAQKKIYFGHRSVGNNIIDGIKDLIKANSQIKLDMVAPTGTFNSKVGFFMHSMIEQDASPQKIAADFQKLKNEVIRQDFDIVLLRFTPFYNNKEMTEILGDYNDSLNQLKNNYPKTMFVHTTFPLNRSKTTWKTWIKKLIGKNDIWEYAGNIKANEFNEHLRKKYYGKKPLFDLAKFESTYPNGERETFSLYGKEYFQLVSDYTYDGVHLNEKGRKIVAEQLLLLLVNIIQ